MVNSGLFSLALAGFAALAAAQPHRNQHRHVARGNLVTQTTTFYVTVTGAAPSATDASVPSASAVVVDSTTSAIAVASSVASVASSVAPSVVSSIVSSSSAYAPATPSSSSTPSSDSSDIVSVLNLAINVATGQGVDSNPNTGKNFPDGQLDCSHFPTEYGAIPMTWVTKGGWSGIQINGGNGDAVGLCAETALCSYACPAGFSKAQWPADQPASGESHGGLLCKGGKLHLTRPSNPQLCTAGTGGVTVKNTLSQFVSICRTDYPGKA